MKTTNYNMELKNIKSRTIRSITDNLIHETIVYKSGASIENHLKIKAVNPNPNPYESENVKAWIEKNGLSYECVYAKNNPNFADSTMVMDHWKITLKKDKRTFDLFYSTGIGHRKNLMELSHSYNRGLQATLYHPSLSSILESLQLDFNALDETFESWCDNFGYSNDSIKAKQLYDFCIQEAIKFKQFLGNDLFNEFMNLEF